MKHVKFLKPCTPYNVDEIAEFGDAVADGFVAAKVAEVVQVKVDVAKTGKKEVQ